MAVSRSIPALFYQGLALTCIGLGAIGIVLPLLPTTPFLLVAAWAAPKGSPRLARWLWTHPRLSPMLIAWRDQRAIPLRAKWLACTLLAISWLTLLAGSAPPGVLAFTGFLFIAVATFIVTRPTFRPE